MSIFVWFMYGKIYRDFPFPSWSNLTCILTANHNSIQFNINFHATMLIIPIVFIYASYENAFSKFRLEHYFFSDNDVRIDS